MEDDIVTQEKWQWQEPGTAWKGAALYHITLTVPDRRPVLSMITTPDGEQAAHGDNEPLRNYKNSCVLTARKGTVMVSPFISPDERQVRQVRLLILSPWPHDDKKRHISRADCVALNAMAEEICTCLCGTCANENQETLK